MQTQRLKIKQFGQQMQNGEGDSFLGLTNPVVRAFVKALRRTTLPEAVKLLPSPWHKVRLCGGLILVELYFLPGSTNG